MTTTESEPIACTLTPGDFNDRTKWIRALAQRSLRSATREALALHLTYGSEAADQVRELVAKEQCCCSFLRFAMSEDAAGIHLIVTAPERAREAADLLFDHFAPDLASSTQPQKPA